MGAAKRIAPAAIGAALVLLGLAFAPFAEAGEPKFHTFQFNDEYLLEQGIHVEHSLDHYLFPDANVERDATRLGTAPDSRYSDVQVIEITGGYMHNGSLLYYIAPTKLLPDRLDEHGHEVHGSFSHDAAGDTQRTTCNAYRAFMFPKKNGQPLSPAPPNRRQDNIFETNGGYFSNNPLGCWRLTFVSWDGPKATSSKCEDHRDDLMEDNGPSLDADTPIIKTLSDINNLAADGCVSLRQRDENGDDGFPWVI